MSLLINGIIFDVICLYNNKNNKKMKNLQKIRFKNTQRGLLVTDDTLKYRMYLPNEYYNFSEKNISLWLMRLKNKGLIRNFYRVIDKREMSHIEVVIEAANYTFIDLRDYKELY